MKRFYRKNLRTHVLPHFDEHVRLCLHYLFGKESFDMNGSPDRTGRPVNIITMSDVQLPEGGQEAFDEAMDCLSVGVGRGKNDEHGKGDPNLSATTMAFEGLTDEEFKQRFIEVMLSYGLSGDVIEACWERFQQMMSYVSHKDNFASARRFGLSHNCKWDGRTRVADPVTGEIGANIMEVEDVRMMMRWTLEIAMRIICMEHNATAGLDPRVDELVCRWICDNKQIKWPRTFEHGMTLDGIIQSIKATKSGAAWIILRRLGQLHKFLYGMDNTGQYGDEDSVDDWLVGRFISTHAHRPFPTELDYAPGMTIEEIVEQLNTMDDEAPNKKALLHDMNNLMKRRESELETRQKNNGQSVTDERDPSSPYNFHAVARMFLECDEGRYPIPALKTDGSMGKRYIEMTLNAWWKLLNLELLGDKIATEAPRYPVVVNGDVVGYMQVIQTSNPTAMARCYSAGADLVVNINPYLGHVCVGMNQHANGMETTDNLLRYIAEMTRIVQYRMDEIPVPENTRTLKDAGTLEDGYWHLAVNGDELAHTFMNGSIHHPHIEATKMQEIVYTTIAWIILTASYGENAVIVIEKLRELLTTTPLAKLPMELLILRSELEVATRAA